jgi:non-heme chloroperoxidase
MATRLVVAVRAIGDHDVGMTGRYIIEDRPAFWLWCVQAGLRGAYECIKGYSETNLSEDLKKIDIPTVIDDQIVPIGDSALLSSKLIKKATLKVYPGAPHGLMVTH